MNDRTAEKAREAVREAASLELAAQDVKTLRDLVRFQQPEIAKALPGTIDSDRYVRTILTELRKTPRLMQCSPESFLGAVLTAAQLGLEFGPMQQAYLVPYGTEIQLIIGYKGWLSLMNRSAEILSVSARTVCEKDDFSFEYGFEESLVHRVNIFADRGKPIAYYAVIRKTNGGRSFAVMTRAEMEKHRDRYGKKNGRLVGPWADPDMEESMMWKTVFLRAKTWVPISAEQQAFQELAQQTDNHIVRQATAQDEIDVREPDDEIIEAEVLNPDDEADQKWVSDAKD